MFRRCQQLCHLHAIHVVPEDVVSAKDLIEQGRIVVAAAKDSDLPKQGVAGSVVVKRFEVVVVVTVVVVAVVVATVPRTRTGVCK